jgi:hypothetical protein
MWTLHKKQKLGKQKVQIKWRCARPASNFEDEINKSVFKQPFCPFLPRLQPN